MYKLIGTGKKMISQTPRTFNLNHWANEILPQNPVTDKCKIWMSSIDYIAIECSRKIGIGLTEWTKPQSTLIIVIIIPTMTDPIFMYLTHNFHITSSEFKNNFQHKYKPQMKNTVQSQE